jgi:hypothetical protein
VSLNDSVKTVGVPPDWTRTTPTRVSSESANPRSAITEVEPRLCSTTDARPRVAFCNRFADHLRARCRIWPRDPTTRKFYGTVVGVLAFEEAGDDNDDDDDDDDEDDNDMSSMAAGSSAVKGKKRKATTSASASGKGKGGGRKKAAAPKKKRSRANEDEDEDEEDELEGEHESVRTKADGLQRSDLSR